MIKNLGFVNLLLLIMIYYTVFIKYLISFKNGSVKELSKIILSISTNSVGKFIANFYNVPYYIKSSIKDIS